MTIVATNLVRNPTLRVDAADWFNSDGVAMLLDGAAYARTLAEAWDDPAALQVDTTGNSQGAGVVVPGVFEIGQPYVGSIYVLADAGSPAVQIIFGDRVGDWTIPSNFISSSAGWLRFYATWTPAANRSNVAFVVRSQAGAIRYFLDAAQVEEGTVPTAYFDGSKTYAAWRGTPDLSISDLSDPPPPPPPPGDPPAPVGAVATRLGLLLDHRRTGDPVNDAILDAIVGGIGDAAERLGVVAFGDANAAIPVPAGRALSDPSVAPLWALAHAALYTGAVPLPGRTAGETEEDWAARARDAAVYPLGIKRGTHEAIRRTIQPLLIGAKQVFIADDFGGPYDLLVRTVLAETPDPAAVEAALAGSFVSGGQRGAIRAELELTYVTADYPTFAEATLRFSDIPNGIDATNVTREDVT